MKPIGPYVAVRDMPGGGPVRTLRATDRLTGMPVLLHVLPFAPRLPELPDHPSLLPVVDRGMDGEDAYIVSELPMQAAPASDPLLAARDVLTALGPLHRRGLAHGGISAAQLWEVDGRVALAGMGLPWQDQPTTGGDLRALVRAVEDIGLLPAALEPLRDAPDAMTATDALALLDAPPSAGTTAAPAQETPPVTAALSEAKPGPADTQAETTTGSRPPELPADTVADTPHDGSPIVLGEPGAAPTVEAPALPHPVPGAGSGRTKKARPVLNRTPASRAAPPAAPVEDRPTAPPPVTPAPPPAPEPVEVSPDASAESPVVSATPAPVPGSPVLEAAADSPPPATDSADVPATGSPVPAYSSAPAGTVETPQERRRRQNAERLEQAKLDAQAAAARKAARLRAEAQDRPAEPIRIGGADAGPGVLGSDDLPDWTPPEDGHTDPGTARPTLKMRTVERLPESLRRPPEPEPVPEPPPSGRLPARHVAGAPIRIGWDEDDSWRVVKTVEGPPARPPRRAPRWLLPLLGSALVLALAGGIAMHLPRPAARAACCDVTFTLRGAAGATARLTVEQAPAGANLTPGQELGRAPGQLHLPAAGTYRLRVVADGYAPGELSVTVPRSLPVSINLGP
ncbi:hypothetical protein HNQ07_003650 [Deinococcus metalli]|uniref:PEGA domain-containing protein n=1 Tax=Deinococcus metalli TaxID=1141878 RepID=A0A7W8KKD5_9DEIO|nr:PEGA domain-containing protein [Deinococcus metalli]MBB5378149.1 hypothetical protein [Deinococcus metalli]GHF56388.1 hypothetical protein GCM10017781_35880 [Deinococcus metalli]